jgi:hypothetical protein
MLAKIEMKQRTAFRWQELFSLPESDFRACLTADQRAVLIARLRLPAIKAEAKERQAAGRKQGTKPPRGAKSGTTARARDVAAKQAGCRTP